MQKDLSQKNAQVQAYWLGPMISDPLDCRPGSNWVILVQLEDGTFVRHDAERHTAGWMRRNPDVDFRYATAIEPERVEVPLT